MHFHITIHYQLVLTFQCPVTGEVIKQMLSQLSVWSYLTNTFH